MYPADITDAQWQIMEKYLEPGSRKREHRIRSIWDGIMYVLKTGCQWRMLPVNFAKWQLAYYYYSKWVDLEVFDVILDKLWSKALIYQGQNAKARLEIMGSESVHWGNNRALNSYDDEKKVKGIKRHMVADKNDFLLLIMVTVAHFHDSKAVMQLMRVSQDAYIISNSLLPKEVIEAT